MATSTWFTWTQAEACTYYWATAKAHLVTSRISFYPRGLIAVAKNNADGTFGAFTQMDAVSSADILVGANNVSPNGASDLLFASPAGTAVQLATGPLTYGPKIYSVSSRMPQVFLGIATPAAGDFNNDGNLDLATPVEGGIALLFGK